MRKITVVVGIIFLLIFSYNIYGAVSGNWGCTPLEPTGCANEGISDDGTSAIKEKTNSLGFYVMMGASFYFQSYSDYQKLLKKIELAEVYSFDFDEAKKIFQSALTNMIMANDTYCRLYESSLMYPQKKEEFIKKLKEFDYTSFQEKYSLVPSVFVDVQHFLSSCDVHGVFERMLNDTDEIRELLMELDSYIGKSEMPNLHCLWKCNQEYIRGQLFGQYVSMVMYEIMNL